VESNFIIKFTAIANNDLEKICRYIS